MQALAQVAGAAWGIMERKRAARRWPVCATAMELRAALPDLSRTDVYAAMGRLHRSGVWRGSYNINKIPILYDDGEEE